MVQPVTNRPFSEFRLELPNGFERPLCGVPPLRIDHADALQAYLGELKTCREGLKEFRGASRGEIDEILRLEQELLIREEWQGELGATRGVHKAVKQAELPPRFRSEAINHSRLQEAALVLLFESGGELVLRKAHFAESVQAQRQAVEYFLPWMRGSDLFCAGQDRISEFDADIRLTLPAAQEYKAWIDEFCSQVQAEILGVVNFLSNVSSLADQQIRRAFFTDITNESSTHGLLSSPVVVQFLVQNSRRVVKRALTAGQDGGRSLFHEKVLERADQAASALYQEVLQLKECAGVPIVEARSARAALGGGTRGSERVHQLASLSSDLRKNGFSFSLPSLAAASSSCLDIPSVVTQWRESLAEIRSAFKMHWSFFPEVFDRPLPSSLFQTPSNFARWIQTFVSEHDDPQRMRARALSHGKAALIRVLRPHLNVRRAERAAVALRKLFFDDSGALLIPAACSFEQVFALVAGNSARSSNGAKVIADLRELGIVSQEKREITLCLDGSHPAGEVVRVLHDVLGEKARSQIAAPTVDPREILQRSLHRVSTLARYFEVCNGQRISDAQKIRQEFGVLFANERISISIQLDKRGKRGHPPSPKVRQENGERILRKDILPKELAKFRNTVDSIITKGATSRVPEVVTKIVAILDERAADFSPREKRSAQLLSLCADLEAILKGEEK